MQAERQRVSRLRLTEGGSWTDRERSCNTLREQELEQEITRERASLSRAPREGIEKEEEEQRHSWCDGCDREGGGAALREEWKNETTGEERVTDDGRTLREEVETRQGRCGGVQRACVGDGRRS